MCTRATMSKLCETDSGYKRRDGWEKLPEVLISKGSQRLRQVSVSPLRNFAEIYARGGRRSSAAEGTEI